MILHVDMDAFYASIEQRDNPDLKGKPVIVGGSATSRGVVSAASYEAREFGVHSAMPTSQALRLCPHGVFLPVRMAHYASIGRHIRDIFLQYTPIVEPLSLDEAFLDIRGSTQLLGPPEQIARSIKHRIRNETQLVASVGVATNKFLAKLASDHEKPDGLVVIAPERIQQFLDPLPVRRLWGVGKKTEKLLHACGIRTVGQLAARPRDSLIARFGDTGSHLWDLAHGIDNRAVTPDEQARSISNETTFAQDISDRESIRSWLLLLTEQVARRLRQNEFRAGTVEVKVRGSDFTTCCRQVQLSVPSHRTEDLWRAVASLFDHRIPDRFFPVRLVGVGCTQLERGAGTVQKLLFDQSENQRLDRLDESLDAIRDRFGNSSILRASAKQVRPGRSPNRPQGPKNE